MHHAVPSILVVLAACGSSPPASPDAAPGPVGTPVTVNVHLDKIDDPTQPAVAAPIYLNNPDGSLAASLVTDASGDAHGIVGDGGSATARWSVTGEGKLLSTVLGLHDGDHVDLTALGWARSAPHGIMAITAPPVTGAAYYTIYDRCESATANGSPLVSMKITKCAGDSLDLLAVARDHAENVIASVEEQGVAFQDGTTHAMPALSVAPSSFAVHLDGVETTASQVTVSLASKPNRYQSLVTVAPPTSASLDIPVATAPSTFTTFAVITKMARDNVSGGVVIDPIQDADTSYTLDLSTAMPAGWITGGSTGRTLTDAPTVPFASDFVYAHWSLGLFTSFTDDWYLVAPPGTTSITAPTLPADAAADDLVAQGGQPGVWFVKIDGFTTYEAAKGTLMRDLAATMYGGKGRLTGIYAGD